MQNVYAVYPGDFLEENYDNLHQFSVFDSGVRMPYSAQNVFITDQTAMQGKVYLLFNGRTMYACVVLLRSVFLLVELGEYVINEKFKPINALFKELDGTRAFGCWIEFADTQITVYIDSFTTICSLDEDFITIAQLCGRLKGQASNSQEPPVEVKIEKDIYVVMSDIEIVIDPHRLSKAIIVATASMIV